MLMMKDAFLCLQLLAVMLDLPVDHHTRLFHIHFSINYICPTNNLFYSRIFLTFYSIKLLLIPKIPTIANIFQSFFPPYQK